MRPCSRRSNFVVVAAALALAVIPAPTSAQVIQNNGVPDNQDGFNITINQWRTANDFTIGASKKGGTTVLNSFDFWVLQQNQVASVTSSFFWQILADDGGSPGSTVVATGNVTNATGTLTSYTCCGTSTFLYAYLINASLGDISIGSGVFWLAVGGYTTTSDDGVWYWATSAQNGNQMQSQQGGPWENVSSEGAFVLYGNSSVPDSTVPEPATLVLMASGLASVAGFRIRRRKRA